jgi:O-succinylbenzoic acid--CoA ligase
MKAHSSFKLFIDNQGINLENLEVYQLDKPWQLSILGFMKDFMSDAKAVKVQTSGSTGKPKVIDLNKEKMANSAKMTGSFLNLKEKDRALLCLSADFIAGKMMLVRAFVLGLEMHCFEPKTEVLKIIKQHFSFSAMVPIQAMASVEHLKQIETLIIGGGSLSAKDISTLRDTKHDGLYQSFGMTETISHVALKRISDKHYSALKGISFSSSENGTLVIDAPLLLDVPIVTNDLVELKSSTSFEWLGRLDNIVNSGGYKIIPEKVEAEIEKVLTKPFFVFGIKDSRYGEKLVLFIESESEELCIEDLKSTGLNKFELPKEIYLIKQFIRTETDKIKRTQTVQAFFGSV